MTSLENTPLNIEKSSFDISSYKKKELILENLSDLSSEDLLNSFYSVENLTEKTRIFNQLLSIYPNSAFDVITNINNTFMFFPSMLLYHLLEELILRSKLSLSLKIESIKCIYEKKEYRDKSFPLFIWVLDQNLKKKSLNHLIEIDTIRYLLTVSSYEEKTKFFLESFFNNESIEINYRYKSLVNITEDDTRKALGRFLLFSYKLFLCNKKYPLYNILSSVWIYNYSTSADDQILCKEILTSLCSHSNDDIKADASDMILQLIPDISSRELATKTILSLGGKSTLTNHVFGSNQNIHNSDINQSIIENCNKLASIHIPDHIKFENISSYLLDNIPSTFNIDKIKTSLIRISMDSLYYPGSQTLKNIFLRIYLLIIQNDSLSTELFKRLYEELIEMSNSCGSGHVGRLINVLSGFNLGFDLNISIKSVLKSRFSNLVQKRIEMIENEDLRDKILDQLSWNTLKDTEKTEWNAFLRNNYNHFYNTLKAENSKIDEKEFDMYFKEILNSFETGK